MLKPSFNPPLFHRHTLELPARPGHNRPMTVSFSDITAMLGARRALPDPCAGACGLVFHQLAAAGIPLSAEWQAVIQRIAQFQNKAWPQIKHPRVAIYASNYGDDLAETQKRLEQLARQDDPLTRLCALNNADLRVYELDLSHQIPATGITEEEAAHALSYGLMAVEEQVDYLFVDSLSAHSETVLFQWQNLLETTDGEALDLLRQSGAGHDLFALLGAVLAARMAGIPVSGSPALTAILPLALARLLPDDHAAGATVFFALPGHFPAQNIVQALAALQELQVILSLGPVPPASKKNLILPNAA